MEMHYSDMVDATFVARRREFRFRIPHGLDKFGADYDPARGQFLFVRLATEADAASFRSRALPAVRRASRARVTS